MLTRKQNEALAFIREYRAKEGVTPSYDEMVEGLGLRSKSGVHRLVIALEARGYITRLPNCARAIRINRMTNPDTILNAVEAAARKGLSGTMSRGEALEQILREVTA